MKLLGRFRILGVAAGVCLNLFLWIAVSGILAQEQGTTNAYKVPTDEQPDSDTYDTINGEYQRILAILIPADHPFKALYHQPLQREKIMLQEGNYLDSSDNKIWLASLYQPLTLTFFHSPLKLRSVQNYALDKYLGEHKDQIQKAPTLSPDQVLAKARDYLKTLGLSVPPSYRLDRCDFNVSNPSMWTVRWQRYAGDYAYDTTNQLLTNYASVSFHEIFGLGSCAVQSFLPEPTSLAVKMNREDAVVKASKVVPLIENTSYYQRGRVAGFVVKSLKEATLHIVVPNWLLDPQRATWVHTKVPSEVRLCWVIRFATVNSKPEPDEKHSLIPPEIIVYIDANTGEIVGGTFT